MLLYSYADDVVVFAKSPEALSMQQNAYSFKENVPYVTGLSSKSVKN